MSDDVKTIGFVSLGAMGRPMAANLGEAGVRPGSGKADDSQVIRTYDGLNGA